MIEIKVPHLCPSCAAEDTMRTAGTSKMEPAFTVVSMINEQDAGRTTFFFMPGGEGCICRMYVCDNCGFVALYFDEKLTRERVEEAKKRLI
jgi:predicted RNA-binding Zn-ribbon protein involved in translation (DUF1610 family)